MLVKPLVVPTKSLALLLARRESASCFCAPRFAARTARNIARGRLSKVGAFMTVAWFSGKCFILERSTTARERPGARRSRSLMRVPAIQTDRVISRGSPCAGSRLRCGVDPIERDAAAPASSVGRLLDGHSSVGSVAAGRVLVGGPAAFARRNKMAEHPENVGQLPVDFSRQ